jgi:zinc/manganese transport system substrate-binding protein
MMLNKTMRLVSALALVGILLASSPARAQVKVVTSLTDLASIATLIGGDQVDAFSIATGFQNPHFVDPKPSYILKLAHADVFVTVGLDLEIGWTPPLLNSARNAKIQKGGDGYCDASIGVRLLQVPVSASREQGDIHVYGNPHYWLDPLNGKIIAQNIFEALVRVDADHRSLFEAKLKKIDDAIDAKTKVWVEKMKPYAGTKVIAYHNEWPYFEQRFGLQIVDFLEPKPGIPPTPSQLLKVINEIKRDHIKIIITSPYFTTESADLVARNTGAKVVTLATSVGGYESIKTYYDLFDYDISQIIEALH